MSKINFSSSIIKNFIKEEIFDYSSYLNAIEKEKSYKVLEAEFEVLHSILHAHKIKTSKEHKNKKKTHHIFKHNVTDCVNLLIKNKQTNHVKFLNKAFPIVEKRAILLGCRQAYKKHKSIEKLNYLNKYEAINFLKIDDVIVAQDFKGAYVVRMNSVNKAFGILEESVFKDLSPLLTLQFLNLMNGYTYFLSHNYNEILLKENKILLKKKLKELK